MKLTIHSNKGVQVINLLPQFFQNEEIFRRGKRVIITPKGKAHGLAEDLCSRSKLKGFILERDGEIILNTLENRESQRFAGDAKTEKSPNKEARHGAKHVHRHRLPSGKLSLK